MLFLPSFTFDHSANTPYLLEIVYMRVVNGNDSDEFRHFHLPRRQSRQRRQRCRRRRRRRRRQQTFTMKETKTCIALHRSGQRWWQK